MTSQATIVRAIAIASAKLGPNNSLVRLDEAHMQALADAIDIVICDSKPAARKVLLDSKPIIEVSRPAPAPAPAPAEPAKKSEIVPSDAFKRVNEYWEYKFGEGTKPHPITTEMGLRLYLINENLGNNIEQRIMAICAVIDETSAKLGTSSLYRTPRDAFSRIMSNASRGVMYGTLKEAVRRIKSR